MNIDSMYEVSEVATLIKNLLEKNINVVNVKGEVTGFTIAASGYIYFSLKDEKATIKCAIFSRVTAKASQAIKNGDKVVVTGMISIYSPRSEYQMIVSEVIPFGIGLLHAKYLQLAEKLKNEGLFDPKHKKPLPKLPQKIGIITSETGAVIQDMLDIISRRYPTEVLFYTAIVQGSEAGKSLTSGITYFSHQTADIQVDVIIIGRGGGSYEDLFCFNDEALIRAIHACPIPVISAVGHETDFTLCDLVADVRAATPSVAAELVVPDREQLFYHVEMKKREIKSKIQLVLHSFHKRFYDCAHDISDYGGELFIHKYQQQLDFAKLKISRDISDMLLDQTQRLQICRVNLIKNQHTISSHIHRQQLHLRHTLDKICIFSRQKIDHFKNDFQNKKERLNANNPQQILQKGYSVVEKDGKIVCSATTLNPDEQIKIKFWDGTCQAKVN
jgi:exodeoxyribonuclease VII large subunit